MFFHMHDPLFLVKKNKIDRKKHSDGVHAPRRDNPKPPAEFGPALRFPQQANKTAEVVVRNRRLGGHKGFPGLVIHVHVSAVIAVTTRHFLSVTGCQLTPAVLEVLLKRLIDRLTFAAPNDDSEHDESKSPRQDPDQRCIVHVSLLFTNDRTP
jgi:hypothetical protein